MTSAPLAADSDGQRLMTGIGPLKTASATDLAFLDNRRYANQLATSHAGACILSQSDADQAPSGMALLLTQQPYIAFAHAMRLFYSDALRSKAAAGHGHDSNGLVHHTAQIEEGATILRIGSAIFS